MSRIFIALVMAIMTVPMVTHAANAQSGATCPSPAPNCTSSGTLFNASYGCTEISTDSSNTVRASIILVQFTSSGTVSSEVAHNDNSTNTTTFKDFTAQSGLTYCINSDQSTGYIFQPTGTGCPLAFVIDNGGTELRFLESQENLAAAGTCRKQ